MNKFEGLNKEQVKRLVLQLEESKERAKLFEREERDQYNKRYWLGNYSGNKEALQMLTAMGVPVDDIIKEAEHGNC